MRELSADVLRRDAEHGEAQQLLGVYALDSVDADEAAVVVAHVGECSECREELRLHLEVTAMLAATQEDAPVDLWGEIARNIPSPIEDDVSLRRPEPLNSFWLKPTAIAAVVVLISGAAVVQSIRLDRATGLVAAERAQVVALQVQLQQPGLDRALAEAVELAGTRQITLGSQVSGATAIIVLMPDGTGYLAEHNLQPLPEGLTYQLWAVVDGKVISAGVLGPRPGIVPFRIDTEGFVGFAITEEVSGGVVASQNDPVIAWLGA